MKESFLSVISVVKISKKLRKKNFGIKKKNLLEMFQNLQQDSTPTGAFCGKQGQVRCDVWIVVRMCYLTNQPTDTASYRGALSHLKN